MKLGELIGNLPSFGERPAFKIAGNSFSYSFLAERIGTIAGEISSISRANNRPVGIVRSDHIDTYAAILACWATGNAYVPLDTTYPEARLGEILKQLNLDFILTAEAVINSEVLKKISILNFRELSGKSSDNFQNSFSGNFPAYILFTSGSTGRPKGVTIARKNLEAYIRSFFSLGYRLSPHDRVLQMFNLTFDMSVMSFVMALAAGACVHTVPSGKMKNFRVFEILEEDRITVALMTPSVVQSVAGWLNEIRLPELRYSIFAGEALKKDLMEKWASSIPNATIHNIYGPTEALGCFNYDCPKEIVKSKSHNGVISIGKPFPGMRAGIANHMKMLEENQNGELLFGGDQLMQGYWNDRENTAKAIVQIPGYDIPFYRSGDLAFRDEDGDYFFLGRSDQQVKIDGFRVELQDIEFQIKKIPAVEDAIVLMPDSGKHAGQLTAFVCSQTLNEKGLRDALSGMLPTYMIPAVFYIPDSFPVNNHGKTDRKKLIQRYG
jgi:amino acid adenylation domain-containing protein